MKVIRLKAVMETTGLARSTIYKYISLDLFPKPISLGGRSVGWLDAEVQAWIVSKVYVRDSVSE